MESFDKALEHGCDGFEFDVRLTADGSAVVCHDASVKGVKISLASQADLPHLARLKDVIQRYHRRVFLDVELKVRGLERAILQVLREHPPERDYVVSSFFREVVTELKARSATTPTGIICEKERQLTGWRQLPVDYVIVQETLVTQRLVQEIHHANMKLLVWTVNDRRSMLRLAQWGVDGIVSDDTELLVRTLRNPPQDTVH
jgi:glycerophosphoryl diester phosphodiesterase